MAGNTRPVIQQCGGATVDRVNASTPALRVLLVDDDPQDRLLILELFGRSESDRPTRVDTAGSYEEALCLISEHRHDVVLTDFQLGAYTGADLLRATAGDKFRPPMIVLTGHGSPEVDKLCLAAGAADYLVKDRLDSTALERSLRYAIERHRLTHQLRERERDYRMLFDASPVPMWVHEPHSQAILEVNIAALKQYGYTRSEFLAMRQSDFEVQRNSLAASPSLNSANKSVASAQESGIRRHFHKDGSAVEAQIVRSEVQLDTGPKYIVLAFDVSAKIRVENALRASESTLRQVLRDITHGLIVTGALGEILFINPAGCEILGATENALLGQPVPAVLMSGNQKRIQLRDQLGVRRELDVRVSETLWNGEAAKELILLDVTQQSANDRQLSLLRRAVESASDGIIVSEFNKDAQPVIYVNPAFERITGYRPSEVIGRDCGYLQGEDRDQAPLSDVRRALAEQRGCTVVLRNYRKDGTMFWNRLTLSPVLTQEGKVTHYIGVVTDISEQRHLEVERTYLATHDAITGLPRFAVGSEIRLELILQRVRENSSRLVLLFVDIDGFNSVNDTMGFATGDLALRQVAERLRELAGPTAEVLRYAGDEFLVAVETSLDTDVLNLATSYCERVAEPMAITTAATLYLTASVGASAFPDCGRSVLELIRQADIATNRAKRGGRNSAFIFGNDLQEALSDRLALGGRMRVALARGEFLLHYQPQVDAQSGNVSAVEALVRWDSPEFGLLPPRRFIPVAEDNGMILQLGAFVLRTACLQMRKWMDAGLSGFIVSVNVSASQMQRPTFVEDVRSIIESTGITPAMLELELTESVLMDNAERAVGLMHELKRLGLRLALDDFGVGYSSLSHLRRFPLDKIKIDQSFISNVTQDRNDAALVRAIIAMGHHLGMKVVAEGVETLAQYGYLKRNHCDELQGFYFSQPRPADEIPALLRHRYSMPLGSDDDLSGRTLLILDDEENIRRSLMRLLRRDGYRILDAENAIEAFNLLATNRVQVILSDQRMPGMSGTEFLSQVKEMYPDTVRIVLSGFTDLASVTESINRGAIYKFLTKPWDDDALRAQVLEAFRRHEHLKNSS